MTVDVPHLTDPVAPLSHRANLASRDASRYWLFSPAVDLAAFLGSAAVALALLIIGAGLGIVHYDAPDWTWISAVLLVDVAHVYATAFRVYFDKAELARRSWLYVLTPLLAFAFGVALHSESDALFWRVLAYLAVFHFVRQQYGWVALYRAKCGETSRLGKWIDAAAIYSATCYPLIYWHTHLPRQFWWFVDRDFAGLPAIVNRIAAPVAAVSLSAYVLRAIFQAVRHRQFNPGKDIVVVTTAACWYLGIVAIDSDYAFTVATVIIHGVPYLVLVYWYWSAGTNAALRPRSTAQLIVIFLATLWLLAYAEELLWDRGVWHDRAWLFGSAWELPASAKSWYVALLAVPQITHYVLDGFIWRRARNPGFSHMIAPPAATSRD